ncbi:MAG: dTDP-4-dehydrorhamnose 3,5-epimerase, partial [Pseudomonadota bacterium]
QDKLVRVSRGRVFDVVVDIRSDSATYKKWISIEVSAEKWNQVLIPKGFAHGFLTLEENTEFLYKVSDFYSKECDRSIKFDDHSIGIEWPMSVDEIILSEKDQNAPLLAEVETKF